MFDQKNFEERKKDHIQLSLNDKVQARALNKLDQIKLIHEALPEMNLSSVSIEQKLTEDLHAHRPFFISSMTAGHSEGQPLNVILAQAAERWGLLMGVGSQRRELSDAQAHAEWKEIRKKAPRAMLLGNIGLSQVITEPTANILKLVESLEAKALFVHTNPLQEALQYEGTPQFQGGLDALIELKKQISVPLILKEVGCGFSKSTLQKVKDAGIHYIDVGGGGGTHWGRIEGYRHPENSIGYNIAQNFANWGLPMTESLLAAKDVFQNEGEFVFASGGVKNGIDVAKCLAMGADLVGMAQPFLKAATAGEEQLDQFIIQTTQELRISMFCTGVETLKDFKRKRVWAWQS